MDALWQSSRARNSKWLVLAEFAIVAGLFVADVYHHIFFSKTLYLFALGWASLRLRGLRWKDVGLTRDRNWGYVWAVGVVSGVLMELFELFVSQPVIVRMTGKQSDLSDLDALAGNWKMLLIFLALTWTLAAFGEEMVYRGYLMNRVAGLFQGTRPAWIVSLIVISILFGCSHIDQGSTGMIENVWNGLLLGLLYLTCGRSLAVPIIAHGVTDTLDVLLIFLRKYPGMH